MYYEAPSTYTGTAELVGFCDANQTCDDYANRVIANSAPSRSRLGIDCFDQMTREQKPDVVIVTSIDRTHHTYTSVRWTRPDVTEKFINTDEVKGQRSRCHQAHWPPPARDFHYCYAPHSTARELMRRGHRRRAPVHFEWTLDTSHGADYFRRWHRDKRNSGGLMVHKATHHFDLVNLDRLAPDRLRLGDLNFYGRENAERRGIALLLAGARQRERAGDPLH
jgi:hypothetical protein